MTRRHEPELDAVTYVSGMMGRRERRRFEHHLLECETCWTEVRLDREGRKLAEESRRAAPPGLRDAIRAAVADAAQDRPVRALRPAARRGFLPVAAAIVSALALLVAGIGLRSVTEPAAIRAALLAYERSDVERANAGLVVPDLTAIGLRPTGDEPMVLDDMAVEAFAYRSDSGSRLTLFMAHAPFPRATESSPSSGFSWHAEHEGIGMMSDSSSSVSYLALCRDSSLMETFDSGIARGDIVIA